jgi:uncharacterized membrane protein required for colicin V production
MSILDISLLIILAGFIINGFSKGLINLVGRIVGLFAGVYIAGHFHTAIFFWAKNSFNISGNEFVGKIITFILVFILATYLIDLLFHIIEKAFNLLAIVPGSKYLNNLAGAILGFFEGALFLGLIIFIASRYAFFGDLLGLGEKLGASVIVPILLKIVDFVLPILPEALRLLKELI